VIRLSIASIRAAGVVAGPATDAGTAGATVAGVSRGAMPGVKVPSH